MGTIFHLAMKDLRILWRDKFGLFWVLAFPLLIALFFGAIFSQGDSETRSMNVAFIGDDSAGARDFEAQLRKSTILQVRSMPLDSARGLVSRGKLVAYVSYRDTAQSQGTFWHSSPPDILIGIDPSRKAESEYLKGIVTQSYFARMQQTFSDPSTLRRSMAKDRKWIDSAPGLDSTERRIFSQFYVSLDTMLGMSANDTASAAGTPGKSPFAEPNIRVEPVTLAAVWPKSSWEVTFPQSLQWALIGCAAAFALSIVTERTRGTYHRLRLAPLTRAQILAGKGLACFIACVTVSVILLAIGVFIFKVRVVSPTGLIAAMVSSSLCFVGLMMLISVLGKTEAAVSGAGWAIMLVFSMTGGGMVPLMVMPKWMLALGNISPIKWSILAYEGAIWRGFGPSDMLLPIGLLLAIGTVGFVAGTVVLRRADR